MFVIVNKWTGEILLEGKRVYETEFSAKKAVGYFLKEKQVNWEIVEIPKPILIALKDMKRDSY